MALKVICGFDYFDTDQIARTFPYSSGGSSIVGRFGGKGWGFNDETGHIAIPVASASTTTMGIAFSFAYGDATNPFIVFQDSTTSMISPITQIDLRVTADAAFQVTRNGGAILGTTSDNLFAFGFWNYLEIKTFIHDSTGFVQLRLNGSTVLNATSLDTKYTGNNFVNMVRIQPFASSGSYNMRIDDLYIGDDSTGINNDLLGECRVQTQVPSADGFNNDFTASGAANNWEAVSEVPPDDDDTFVASAVVGDIDDYVMGTVALTGTIYGMQLNIMHRKDDVGSRIITPTIRSAGTYYEGALFDCQSDYTVAQKLWEREPNGNTVWTNTLLNGITAGTKIKG